MATGRGQAFLSGNALRSLRSCAIDGVVPLVRHREMTESGTPVAFASSRLESNPVAVIRYASQPAQLSGGSTRVVTLPSLWLRPRRPRIGPDD